MTIVWTLLSLFAVGGSLGCGAFLHSLLSKKNVSVSLELSERAGLKAQIEELRKTIEQIEHGVRQHGDRLSTDTVTLNTKGLPPAQARILQRLIEANNGFGQQMSHWADGVRRTGEKITPSNDPRPSTNGQDRDASSGSHKVRSETSRNERRQETRYPFFCRQWIAPYNGVRAPVPDEFFAVQCRDISSSGIAFFLQQRPNYELVVIRLPDNDGSKYLTARIQRLTRCEESEHGSYVAGCLFLGCIHANALASHLEASIKKRERQLVETAVCQ